MKKVYLLYVLGNGGCWCLVDVFSSLKKAEKEEFILVIKEKQITNIVVVEVK